jgi:hypothetical protein
MRESQTNEADDGKRLEAFIAHWQGREGGQERANYALFLTQLCSALGLPDPDPADRSPETNDYVFERVVKEVGRDGSVATKRIDLYKRNCFVLEAKQSRQQKGGDKEVFGQADLFGSGRGRGNAKAKANANANANAKDDEAPRGRRGAEQAWDVLMMNARRQAEDYVHLLPASHEPPPFILVSDVGHCFEIYANFRRDGKAYDQFPDRQSFRVYLEDLKKPEVRDRLVHIWADPMSLDPARRSARVTRDIAQRLAAVSKALEEAQYPAEEVAMFLMRCIFTMFAEDVGLLPEKSFKEVLQRCEAEPDTFVQDVGQLWEAMDVGGYAHAIRKRVPKFNGEFFRIRKVLPLGREEIGELRQAASYDWRDVEPAIFGTLLEQALNSTERRRLGAHYTPRAYVERLVVATIIEPLRTDWNEVLSTAERQKSERRNEDAEKTVRAFHDKLCQTRVLDPACGTGNFLYVSLELMKRLEGEVLEALVDLGGQEALSGLSGHTVGPHQFFGMEINPRAAAIAELVLWIGHLQWHLRTKGGMPSEPILKAFKNITVMDAVLAADKSLARDEQGRPITHVDATGTAVEVYTYSRPRRPNWPQAEFIVGNPPFIGGKDIRARTPLNYAEALWAAHPRMNESADYVMYWWDRAAEFLVLKGTILRNFGLVTTNSISQVYQRRVVTKYLQDRKPVSLIMAVPDHPWTKATPGAAAVRIAMTVGTAGLSEGVLMEVIHEAELETDTPKIEIRERHGQINSDLTIGVDTSKAIELAANNHLCSNGMKPLGAGFLVTEQEAQRLGVGRRSGLERHIRRYRNGRDLTAHPRGVLAIDFYGLTANEVRRQFPEAYQHLASTVRPEREAAAVRSNTRDAQEYAEKWWLFCKPRQEMRDFLNGLDRFIITVQTARHRIFQFLPAEIMPDQKLMVFGLADAFTLGVLSSRIHTIWTLRTCSWLGVGNDSVYVKTRTFDTFPFPSSDDSRKRGITAIAEELNKHRGMALAEHPNLTMTGMYNVLERLYSGVAIDQLTIAERRIFDDGHVLILRELHDNLNAAVAAAYGWPTDLSDEDIVTRLVALNKERAEEEARGLVQWLRPEYQVPRFGTPQEKAEFDLFGVAPGQEVEEVAVPKTAFPTDDVAQTAAVMAALAASQAPLAAEAIAISFRQGRRILVKVQAVLAALTRMGFVSTADGGKTFAVPRSAVAGQIAQNQPPSHPAHLHGDTATQPPGSVLGP